MSGMPSEQCRLFYHFGISLILISLIVFGFVGLKFFLNSISDRTVRNGTHIKVVDVKNKNSEAISYIGTYIIPFLFQDFSSKYALASMAVLFMVIFFIYINSSLIMINPPLNMFYSLYEIGFEDKSEYTKTGMLITKEDLEEGDNILVKNIGHKLFFGKKGK